MLCFYRWSAQGKFFGRLGEDSISIYETPVSCHPEYSPKNRSLCGNIFSHFCREVFILKYCGKRKVLSNRWILSMSDFTLYIITVVVIFSSLFSLHFVWYWQGEFVWQSGGSWFGDHFLFSSWPLYLIQGWDCDVRCQSL